VCCTPLVTFVSGYFLIDWLIDWLIAMSRVKIRKKWYTHTISGKRVAHWRWFSAVYDLCKIFVVVFWRESKDGHKRRLLVIFVVFKCVPLNDFEMPFYTESVFCLGDCGIVEYNYTFAKTNWNISVLSAEKMFARDFSFQQCYFRYSP